jgi:hypothetical protein
LIFGNPFALNAAQCEQVIDAYSVIVAEALAGPSAISGTDTGLATSDALCAIASAIRCSGENPASAGKPGQRRKGDGEDGVMNISLLRNSALVHTHAQTVRRQGTKGFLY